MSLSVPTLAVLVVVALLIVFSSIVTLDHFAEQRRWYRALVDDDGDEVGR